MSKVKPFSTIEELRAMPLSEAAKVIRHRVHECRKEHKVIDCPSCSCYYSKTECPFNRLFPKHLKQRHTTQFSTKDSKQPKPDYAEKQEAKINKNLEEWKRGK